MFSKEFVALTLVFALPCLFVLTKYDWDSGSSITKNVVRYILHIPVATLFLLLNFYLAIEILMYAGHEMWPLSNLEALYLQYILFPALAMGACLGSLLASIELVLSLRRLHQKFL